MEWVCGKILLSESVFMNLLKNVSLHILFFSLQDSCFIGKNISLMFSNQAEKVREGTGSWVFLNSDNKAETCKSTCCKTLDSEQI